MCDGGNEGPLPLRRKGGMYYTPFTRQGETMGDTELNVFRSSLDLVILKALSWGPRHGYAVAEWIDQATSATILIEEGTLYPALHRLERKRWVDTEWGVSENNRRAKFYRLTPAGRAQLRNETPTWLRHAEAIAQALRATTPELA